jgi:AcrR family transcriptional regulator
MTASDPEGARRGRPREADAGRPAAGTSAAGTSAAGRRGGRRPGDSGTRAAILSAARDGFATQGYAGTTIRGVAAAAGVDPALVNHFYGSKDGLFAASLEVPADLPGRLLAAVDGDRDGVGERLVRFYLGLWEDPVTAGQLRAMMTSAVSHEQAASLLRQFVDRLLTLLADHLAGDDRALRVALSGSQLVGIAFARYLVGIEPLARADVETIVSAVAPTVQRYVAGDLHGG